MSFPFHPITHELAGHVLAAPLAETAVHLPYAGPATLAGLGVTTVAGLAVKASHTLAHRHTNQWPSLWLRLKWRVHPGPGFAGRWELHRRYGKPAARKIAQHGRPSLTWTDRRFGSWTEYATFQGWAQGWVWRRRVYSTFEDVVLVISAPQEGKSAKAAGSIIDAPGPVVATSIRGELIHDTAGLRAKLGRLHILNPEGAGDVGSTFEWNLVEGCNDAYTAVNRGGWLVEALTNRGLSDADFWSDQASMVIGAYLHAAGLVGGNFRLVHRWILERSQDPLHILKNHPQAAENAVLQVAEYLQMPERTRSGVITTLNRVMKFMQDPAIVAILSPPNGKGFDFDSFLTSKDTLYLVAADSATSPVSPLFVTFLGELVHRARLHPARTGAKRLDPPLTLELDEIANIAPVPVANWASWAAGSGIRIHMYGQAWAQFVQRWGKEGSETIWQSAKCKVIFTGTSEQELCEKVSALGGQVRVVTGHDVHEGRDGKQHRRPRYEMVDVLPAAAVRQLPDGRAIVIRRNAKPTIVRTEKSWKRADVKAYRRSGQVLHLVRPIERPAVAVRPDLLARGGPAVTASPAAEVGAHHDDLAARRRARHDDGPAGDQTGQPTGTDPKPQGDHQ